MGAKYRDVTKEEFDRFVSAYPEPLEKDVTGICEPPVLTYNDFTKGSWPESVVAKVALTESYPRNGIGPYQWKPNTYSILGDCHE